MSSQTDSAHSDPRRSARQLIIRHHTVPDGQVRKKVVGRKEVRQDRLSWNVAEDMTITQHHPAGDASTCGMTLIVAWRHRGVCEARLSVEFPAPVGKNPSACPVDRLTAQTAQTD
jgi:hypothetical protein